MSDLISKIRQSRTGIVLVTKDFTASSFVESIRKERCGLRDEKDYEILLEINNAPVKVKPDKKPIDEKKKLYAMIAFDVTSSMRPYINQVRKEIDYVSGNLLDMLDVDISVMGVGDHCDGKNMLQIMPYTSKREQIKKDIKAINNTDGGDTPEAYECLFKELNTWNHENPSILVMIIDSVPHGTKNYKNGRDSGCPYNVDYKKELDELKKKVSGIAVISCSKNKKVQDVQREIVSHPKYFMELKDVKRVPDLIMGMCMSEAGKLDYLIANME